MKNFQVKSWHITVAIIGIIILFYFNATLGILAVLAVAGYFVYDYQKHAPEREVKRKYVEEHQLNKARPADFNQDENIYWSARITSVREIFDKLDKKALNETLGYGWHYDNEKRYVQFTLGDWNCSLTTLEARDGSYRYKFRLGAWHRSRPSADLNYLLTAIEQAVLELDKEALVQRQRTDEVVTTRHSGTGIFAFTSIAENAYEKHVAQPKAEAAAAALRVENAKGLATKFPLINDYPNWSPNNQSRELADSKNFTSENNTSPMMTTQGQAISSAPVENTALPTKKEWQEYFQMINGRQPTLEEFTAAKDKQEFR